MASLSLLVGLAVTPVGMPPEANAQINVDIRIGLDLSRGRRISCAEGERLLRDRGFRDIRRRDCRGRYFVYRGTRRGGRFEIAIRSSNGRIADVRRLGRA
jgi:hypothetical protein